MKFSQEKYLSRGESIRLFFLFILIFTNFSFAQQIKETAEIKGSIKEGSLEGGKLKGGKLKGGPEGKEFWIAFMKNHNDPERMTRETMLNLELFITSEKDAEVRIDIDSLAFHEVHKIKGGEVKKIKLSPLAVLNNSEVITKGIAVHIVSNEKITVYGLNRRKLTTDTFLALPISVIGKEYLAMCYDVSVGLMSEFAIVATEDSTTVEIIPSVLTKNDSPADSLIKIVLNEGDAYLVSAKNLVYAEDKCDLTGSFVKADKPISFFSGHQCAYVPSDVIACNHLVEQLPPTNSWGNKYYLSALQKRSKYVFRVLAREDNTKIFKNGKMIDSLDKGEFLERMSSGEEFISSSKAILVSQYSLGFAGGDSIGDPMMLLISPAGQYLKKYRFVTPVSGSWEHFINVICPNDAINSLVLDGAKVRANQFKQIPNSNYSVAYLKVEYGTHEIECEEGFGLSSYGFGFGKDRFDAYGNVGGQSFKILKEIPDTLSPYIISEISESGVSIDMFDDRSNDGGLKMIKPMAQDNINYGSAPLEIGAPVVNIKLRVENKSKSARIVFYAEDLSGNSAVFSICYGYNYKEKKYEFTIQDGLQDCEYYSKYEFSLSSAFEIGTLGIETNAGLNTLGEFSDNSVSQRDFGLEFTYSAKKNLLLGSRLSFAKIDWEISAPDSISSKIISPQNGEIISSQKASFVRIDGSKIDLMLFSEYYYYKHLFVGLGLRTYLLAGNAKFTRKIIYPNFVTGGEEIIDDNLDISRIQFLGTISAGIRLPINYMFDFSANLSYNYPFTNILGRDWNYRFTSFTMGIIYKF
jgi:IgGFc binding protein